jgi:hypothetical protein
MCDCGKPGAAKVSVTDMEGTLLEHDVFCADCIQRLMGISVPNPCAQGHRWPSLETSAELRCLDCGAPGDV